MDNRGAEKRRFRRIYFPGDLVVSGVVVRSDARDAEFPVKVLNLSEGGLFFTILKAMAVRFQEEGAIVFKSMRGPAPFSLSQDLTMEIKWVCDSEMLESVGYGCEFIDPPSDCVERLRGMVDSFLMDYRG